MWNTPFRGGINMLLCVSKNLWRMSRWRWEENPGTWQKEMHCKGKVSAFLSTSVSMMATQILRDFSVQKEMLASLIWLPKARYQGQLSPQWSPASLKEATLCPIQACQCTTALHLSIFWFTKIKRIVHRYQFLWFSLDLIISCFGNNLYW